MFNLNLPGLKSFFFFIVFCLILLGAFIEVKIGPGLSSIVESGVQMNVLAYAATPDLYPSPTPHPTATPDQLAMAALALSPFAAQTAAAGNVQATVEAAQAGATQTSIARTQELEAIMMRATVTAIALQIKATNGTEAHIKGQAPIDMILIAALVIALVVCAVVIITAVRINPRRSV